MYLNIEFAEKLKELMDDYSYDVDIVASLAKVSTETIYRYLSGQCLPELKNAINIANAFNCTLQYLFDGHCMYEEVKVKSEGNFSATFNQLLKEKNKKEYQLHKELKLSRSVLFAWTRYQSCPSIESLFKLANYFNCSIDLLVGREFY